MKIVVKLLCVAIIVGTTPLLLLFYTLVSNGSSTDSIKTTLAQSSIYEQLPTRLEEQVAAVFSEQKIKSSRDPLLDVIKAEITPVYIQTKVENLIDQTSNWMTGKTTAEPTLNFQDIKDRLVSQHKKQYDQLVFASKQLKKQQAILQQTAIEQENLDTLHEINILARFDFEKFLTSDPTIHMGTYLAGIKSGYQLMVTGLPILSGVWLLTAGFLLWLNPTKVSKLRWLGTTCAAGGVSSLVQYGILLQGSQRLALYLSQTDSTMPTVLKPLLVPTILPLLKEYSQTAQIAAIILLATAVITYATAVVISTRDSTKSRSDQIRN